MASVIEQSELRPDIERMILNGKSQAQVAEWAKRNGLDISGQAVKRHKDKYGLTPITTNHAGLSDEDLAQLTDESVLHIDAPNISNGDDAVRFARETAQRIYCNQLAIVEAKQQAYMRGEGRYPHMELMGLKNVLAVLGAMTDSKDKAITSSTNT